MKFFGKKGKQEQDWGKVFPRHGKENVRYGQVGKSENPTASAGGKGGSQPLG